MPNDIQTETEKLRRAVENAKVAPFHLKIQAVEQAVTQLLAWAETVQKTMEERR